MKTLVFLEHHDGELQKGALGVLAKAASLGEAAASSSAPAPRRCGALPARTGRRACTSRREAASTRRCRSHAST